MSSFAPDEVLSKISNEVFQRLAGAKRLDALKAAAGQLLRLLDDADRSSGLWVCLVLVGVKQLIFNDWFLVGFWFVLLNDFELQKAKFAGIGILSLEDRH